VGENRPGECIYIDGVRLVEITAKTVDVSVSLLGVYWSRSVHVTKSL